MNAQKVTLVMGGLMRGYTNAAVPERVLLIFTKQETLC